MRTITEIQTDLATVQAQWASYNNAFNEGGDGFNPHSAALRALQAEYDAAQEYAVTARHQAQLAAEDAAWTRDVTIARRAAWNAWVQRQGPTIHAATVAAHCQEIGYDISLLQRQIKRHGL